MRTGGRAKPQRSRPGDPGWPSADIVKLAEVATSGPFYDDSDPDAAERGPFVCRKCTSVLSLDEGDLEPTPLCNLCAQDAVRDLGAEVLIARDAIAELDPVIGGQVRRAMNDHRERVRVRGFVDGVLGLTTDKVLGGSRARRRK